MVTLSENMLSELTSQLPLRCSSGLFTMFCVNAFSAAFGSEHEHTPEQ